MSPTTQVSSIDSLSILLSFVHIRLCAEHKFVIPDEGVQNNELKCLLNSLPASHDFCHLLITFANSLGPDQDRQTL